MRNLFLLPDESIKISGKAHMLTLIWDILSILFYMAVLVAVFYFSKINDIKSIITSKYFWIFPIVTLIMIILLVKKWKNRMITVTNKRVIYTEGIFYSSIVDIPIYSITQASVNKGLLGLIFGFGTVCISSPGGTVKIRNIARCDIVRMALLNAINTSVKERYSPPVNY